MPEQTPTEHRSTRTRRDPDWERLRVEEAQRDPSQFGPLYEAHFEGVYAYLARRIRERAEVEDLTAEVFRKALDGLPHFEWRGAPFGAWLLRIAANTLTDRARRALRAVPSEPEPEAEPGAAGGALDGAELFRLVAALPVDQRRVIELRFAEDRSIREIATELGRTEGAVKQLQLRALQSLRKQVRRDDA